MQKRLCMLRICANCRTVMSIGAAVAAPRQVAVVVHKHDVRVLRLVHAPAAILQVLMDVPAQARAPLSAWLPRRAAGLRRPQNTLARPSSGVPYGD